MILIGAHNISKSFSVRPLFRGLTFSIESGERIGLIGPNGAGKSTLLKILSGKQNIDDGKLTFAKGIKVAFVEQVPEFSPESTVNSVIMEGASDIYDWEEISRAQELASKLELSQWGEEKLISELSGGWKKRVAIARELMRQPDLLLLDEPTNHLDVESIIWLEEMLANAKFATLTITHDRLFLQKISNRIIEINPKYKDGMLSVRGSYADFLESRDDLLAAQLGHEQKLKNTLRRETEWLRRGAKARQTKQQARIEATHDLASAVDEISVRNRNQGVKFDFQSGEKSPKKLIEAKGISKAFNGQTVVPNIDILVTPKSRIGLLGLNGCGKSTLIKILTDEIKPDTGTVNHAERLEISYFEQNRESLNPNESLFRTICPIGDHVDFAGTLIHARSYLSRFLFHQDKMDMPVYKLSGGEQSRLLLAKVMLTKANLLVLDEPTNDLDMETLDMLLQVLQDFNGAILLVTHDRYFMDQMTNQILAFGIDEKGNKIIEKMVGIEQWEDWHGNQLEIQQKISEKLFNDKKSPTKNSDQKPKNSTEFEKKMSSEKHSQDKNNPNKKEIEKIEKRIMILETELKTQENILSQTQVTDVKKFNEQAKLVTKTQNEIEELYRKWTEITENH